MLKKESNKGKKLEKILKFPLDIDDKYSIMEVSQTRKGFDMKSILKKGTKVEFALTGVLGSVVAIQNDAVIFENDKGEEIIHNFKTIEGMLKSGALKV